RRRHRHHRPQAGPAVSRRVAFALGANLGDRLGALCRAVAELASTEGVRLVGVSSAYETEPVGGPPGQPAYLNAVAVADSELRPEELLARAREVEAAHGRARAQRW